MLEPGSLKKAEEILLQKPQQNAYILLRLWQGGIGLCWLQNNSVCLWDKEHNKYCYTVENANDLRTLYAAVRPRDPYLISIVTDDAFLADIQALDRDIHTTPCFQLQSAPYRGTPPIIEDVQLDRITAETVDWMLRVYQHPEMNKEFILQRTAISPAIAAYHQGKPVGFFITHSDAELGPVYVDSAFRGSGLAEAMYAEIMKQVGKQPATPVLFVLPENQASFKWLQRMGCIPAPQKIVWFWRE